MCIHDPSVTAGNLFSDSQEAAAALPPRRAPPLLLESLRTQIPPIISEGQIQNHHTDKASHFSYYRRMKIMHENIGEYWLSRYSLTYLRVSA